MGEGLLPLILLAALSGAYLWLVLKFPPAILLANVTYSAITKTVSVLYLEINEVFLFETGRLSGWSNGATVRQLVYNLIIVGTAVIVMRWMVPAARGAGWRQRLTANPQMMQYAFWAAVCLLAIQTINMLITPGIPLFTGNTRQVFWEQDIRVPLLRQAMGVLMIFVPMVGSYLLGIGWVSKSKRLKRRALWLLLAYFVFLIVGGQKMNGLMVGLFVAAAPFWIVISAAGAKISVKKWGAVGLVGLSAVLAISSIGFEDRVISQDRGGAAAGIAYRAFAVQGGVAYTADAIAQERPGFQPGMLFGDMEQTIRTLTPADLADRYVYGNVNLAGSLPGTASMAVGFSLTLFVCAFYGALLGLLYGLITRRVLRGRIWQLFLFAYMHLWTIGVYARGSFDELIAPNYLIFTGALVILAFWTPPRPVSRTTVRRRVAKPGESGPAARDHLLSKRSLPAPEALAIHKSGSSHAEGDNSADKYQGRGGVRHTRSLSRASSRPNPQRRP